MILCLATTIFTHVVTYHNHTEYGQAGSYRASDITWMTYSGYMKDDLEEGAADVDVDTFQLLAPMSSLASGLRVGSELPTCGIFLVAAGIPTLSISLNEVGSTELAGWSAKRLLSRSYCGVGPLIPVVNIPRFQLLTPSA